MLRTLLHKRSENKEESFSIMDRLQILIIPFYQSLATTLVLQVPLLVDSTFIQVLFFVIGFSVLFVAHSSKINREYNFYVNG
ncbi:hypothetical protein [Peribacillus asahii]|uniref:hypothetical protein n=1 Tax=Peribacillus asahii TaxID=228899 RepID=UPI00207A2D28|nr:hypothetical protein [Peribacillus asahii]USK62175.1 hypothetical protein LIT37_23650 [Peribacillus asahii]